MCRSMAQYFKLLQMFLTQGNSESLSNYSKLQLLLRFISPYMGFVIFKISMTYLSQQFFRPFKQIEKKIITPYKFNMQLLYWQATQK